MANIWQVYCMPIHASIEFLHWESEFFQLRSAKLNFSPSAPLISLVDFSPWALVQAKISAQRLDLVDALSQLDFRLAESEIDFFLTVCAKNIAPVLPDNNDDSSVRLATKEDIPILQNYAASVFGCGRFRPPWYRQQDSGRFYATWVENAVLGTFDHQCLLVINKQGYPQGFVTLRDMTQGEARIGLLAVFPAVQGKGIGRKLMWAARQWCQLHQLHLLRIATQSSNIAALRLYVSSGAVIASTAYWLYRR